MIMLNYVSHELANKVYQLTKILDQTNKVLQKFEEENTLLKQQLNDLYAKTSDQELVEVS